MKVHETYAAFHADTLSPIVPAPMCACGNPVDSDCFVGFDGVFTFLGWNDVCLSCHLLADVARYGCE